jgi:PPOX class probable F420-dependent enzyme
MQHAPPGTRGVSIESERGADAAELSGARYISVTTFRRNDEPVATPVEFVEQGNALYIRSRGTGKIKRIRNNLCVRAAPCTMRGRETAPARDGVASFMSDEATATLYPLFSKKYDFLWRLGIRLRRPRVQGVKILLSDPSETA